MEIHSGGWRGFKSFASLILVDAEMNGNFTEVVCFQEFWFRALFSFYSHF